MFYERLFTLAPEARMLFKGDMAEQRKKLMDTLAFLVMKLREMDQYVGMIEDLGKRHVSYGATRAHYDVVGVALIWMLEQQLGPAFTPSVKSAWVALYTAVASTMLRAADEVKSVA